MTYGAEFWTVTNKMKKRVNGAVQENSEKNILAKIRELLCENKNVNKKFLINLTFVYPCIASKL